MQNYKDRYIRNDPRKTNENCQLIWSDNYKKIYNTKNYKNLASEHGIYNIEGFQNNSNTVQTKQSINTNNNQEKLDINGKINKNLGNNNIQIVNNNRIGKSVRLGDKNNIKISGDIGVNRYDFNIDNYQYLKNESKKTIRDLQCKYGNKVNINNKSYDINLPTLMKKEIFGDINEIDKIYNNKIVSQMRYDIMKVENMKNIMKRLNYTLEDTVIKANESHSLNDPFFQNMFIN